MNEFNTQAALLPKKEQISGVSLLGYYPLKFTEHIWNTKKSIECEQHSWSYQTDELLSMVNMVVKVDELNCYMVKNKYRALWEKYDTKSTVFEKLFNDYQQFQYESIGQNVIYTADINKLRFAIYGKIFKKIGENDFAEMHAGTIPSVYTIVNYPMQNEFLCTDMGQFALNIGASYETLEGEFDYEKCSRFLRMIYRSLCNYPALVDAAGNELSDEDERQELFEKVITNGFTEEDKDFKFVLSWCAALVQRPGINLMTNMWFAGEYQGIGKGTLVNFLKAILGKDRACLFKPNMINGSFNGQLHGKFLLEINEKQTGISPQEMSNWLKGFSQEDDIQIEKKGQDPFTTVNMVNVLGSAQTAEDVFNIEDEDRRNVIFRTVVADTDPGLYWRKYAKHIATQLKNTEGWAESVAWLLERVEIDWDLVSTSYQTRGYAEVKQTQLSAKNPLYLWAQAEFIQYAKLGSKVTASILRDDFLKSNMKSSMSQNTFNKRLKELVGAAGMPQFTLYSPANILTAKF